jgi:acyl-CoA thioesterase FadM
MPRIKLEIPEDLPFKTEIDVRITDINYGNHLGNNDLLGLLHEARVRMLARHGFTELDAGGAGIIMADTAIVFKSEVVYGLTLLIEVGVTDIHRRGCDVVYRVSDAANKAPVALAKTGIVFFDYAARKLQPVPEAFRKAFPQPAPDG